MTSRHEDWLRQAENDLEWARHSLAGEFFAQTLDLYYVSGRYSDAFPAGAPFELLTRPQAERALAAAEEVVGTLRARMSVP
ncbi:MAG: hypothetical protein IH608_06170 [Proteobacteria bacterium]|nr:hypothetical protein [Pseudomonadota bacterium]